MTGMPFSLTGHERRHEIAVSGSRLRIDPPLSAVRSLRTRIPWRRCALSGLLVAATMAALVSTAVPAAADFRLCNNTGSRVGIAIGYKDADGWITEGWWNLAARSCDTLLKGVLVARFYYVYAVDYDHGGEWSGKAFMCTREKEFTIRGIEDCLAKGYDRTGFFEVDTGEQRSWTVQLTETSEQTPQQPPQQYTPLIPSPGGSPPFPGAPAAQPRPPGR
jgi:uncharacterized membrane protein